MSEMVCSVGILNASCRACPHCGAGNLKHHDTVDDQFDVCQSCGRSSGLVRKPVLHERLAPRTWRGLTPGQLRILAALLAEDAAELRPRRSGFDVMEGLTIVSKRLEREAKRRERKGGGQWIALAALIKDLRAAGIPYEPDLTWPPPVRHRTALYVALGHLCDREEEYGPLGTRVKNALRWIKALGRRSRWAAWFERDF